MFLTIMLQEIGCIPIISDIWMRLMKALLSHLDKSISQEQISLNI
nr:MAG TPA: hypothetical protein [Caudoviricetes sp.]